MNEREKCPHCTADIRPGASVCLDCGAYKARMRFPIVPLVVFGGIWAFFGPWFLLTALKIGIFSSAGLMLGAFGGIITALGIWLAKHTQLGGTAWLRARRTSGE